MGHQDEAPGACLGQRCASSKKQRILRPRPPGPLISASQNTAAGSSAKVHLFASAAAAHRGLRQQVFLPSQARHLRSRCWQARVCGREETTSLPPLSSSGRSNHQTDPRQIHGRKRPNFWHMHTQGLHRHMGPEGKRDRWGLRTIWS